MYSISNSLLEYQKIDVPANYLTAKLQIPQLDEYTEQIQRSHIHETHQIRELKNQIHSLKTKNHQLKKFQLKIYPFILYSYVV